ncbi:MAG: protein O-mannosyl-transferase family, partial [Ignavibacteria bacterium]
RQAETPQIIKIGITLFSCLTLAFSKTFWSQANSVEVYSLHIFFLVSLFFVFLKAINTSRNHLPSPLQRGNSIISSVKTNFVSENKYYLIFSFLLGLSFTNHLTTILLAPACLTLFLVTNLKNKKSILPLIGIMSVCFLIGFSVYLYLPIRAAMNPIFLWGNPYNLERFYWHITGKQFSVWIFSAQGSIPVFLFLLFSLVILSVIGLKRRITINKFYHFSVFLVLSALSFIMLSSSSGIVEKQFKFFLNSLLNEFGTGLFLFAILGIYKLSEFNLNIYYLTVLSFLGCLFYSVNYDIHDISSYFLLAYIVTAIWIGFGALYIYEKIDNFIKSKTRQLIFSVVIVLLSVITLKSNYGENDESKNYYVEEYTMNVFRNIEPNGVIISSQWDFWISSSWYYNFVKKIRTDIVVIDKELLRRSWYFTYLRRNYPEIYENSKGEIERFLSELYKFEHNIPYEQKVIMRAFSDLLTSFVEKNPSRNIYTTWEIERDKNETFAVNYNRIPDGILSQLVKIDTANTQEQLIKTYDFNFTPTTKKNYYHETIMLSYASMLTNSANYLFKQNRITDARKYLDLALSAISNFPQALELKKKIN